MSNAFGRSPSLSLRSSAGYDNKLNVQLLVDDDEDENENENDPEIKLACVLFCLVGIGYLFPFSALTQPVDYWKLLFPDFNIEFPLTTLYMWTNLIMLGILVFFFSDGSSSSFTPRIVGGFVGQLLVLVFVPTSYFWHLSESWNEIAVLGATAAAAIVSAFLDSSVIALSCQYPLRVQEALQVGVGVSTLIGSLYRDATKAAFPPGLIVESSLLYFYTGALTIALCIAAYCKLMQLDLSKKCLARAAMEEKAHHHDTLALVSTEGSPLLGSSNINNEEDASSTMAAQQQVVDKWVVLRKVWFNELMVGLLFLSTLALWPPLVTEIASFNFLYLQASGWWPLILLTIFSCSDCLGRVLVRFRMGLTRHNIWIAVLARFGIFPLIVCSVRGVFFTNDVYSVVFVSLLGFTNGYVGTLCIVLVNECITVQEQALAGTFTSFSLNTGLVLGATLGSLMEKLVVG